MHVVLLKVNAGRRRKHLEDELSAFVIDGLVLLVVHLVLSIAARNSWTRLDLIHTCLFKFIQLLRHLTTDKNLALAS